MTAGQDVTKLIGLQIEWESVSYKVGELYTDYTLALLKGHKPSQIDHIPHSYCLELELG